MIITEIDKNTIEIDFENLPIPCSDNHPALDLRNVTSIYVMVKNFNPKKEVKACGMTLTKP